MENEYKGTVIVISAHPGDFVWRSGGAIALHKSLGYKVRVLCLSFGEIGESASLWKQGKSLEEIKAIRKKEAERSAEILGAEIKFFDIGDYPLEPNTKLKKEIVKELRKYKPEIVFTHSEKDPYNIDHERVYQLTKECCILAHYGHGIATQDSVTGPIQVYQFEPHQPEQSNFHFNTLLDISEVFETKKQAIENLNAQQHAWEYYYDLAKRRGLQARRNSGLKDILYAEAFYRVYPVVSKEGLL